MNLRTLSAFLVEVVMFDAVTTREADGEGVPGFDDDFKEITVISSPARTEQKKEQEPIFIPSQIEDTSYEALMQMSAGNVPDSKMGLVWARKDLAAMNLLVPETGECLVRVNDRIASIRDRCSKVLFSIRTPPGLYITEIRPTWGLAGAADLFLVTLNDREQSTHQ